VRGARISGGEAVEHATMKAGGSAEAVALLLLQLQEVITVLERGAVGRDMSEPLKKDKKEKKEGASPRGDGGVVWRGVCEVRDELEKVEEQSKDAATAGFAPLALYAVAPVPIAQFNPKFDDNFTPEFNMDPDRERAERAKLKRQAHKEFKGAVRELRKDNQFLEAEKAVTLKKQRALRDERGKSIETFLSQEQFEANLGAGKKAAKGRKRK